MNSDIEEGEVFTDLEDPSPLREEDDEEGTGEEEDASNFSAWMQLYGGGDVPKKAGGEGKKEGEEDGKDGSFEVPAPMRSERRASLPCQATLLAMQFSRIQTFTRAPVTAKVLLRRSSSRRLLPSAQEVTAPAPERRTSLIPTIPEAASPERRGQFRRRNVMSLSDADCVCLICYNNFNRGSGSTSELQCTHTFHKECIEEWLWRKQSCPTCHVQVSMPRPFYWSSTRVKVP